MHDQQACEQDGKEEQMLGADPFHDEFSLPRPLAQCIATYHTAKNTNSTTKKRMCFTLTDSIVPCLLAVGVLPAHSCGVIW